MLAPSPPPGTLGKIGWEQAVDTVSILLFRRTLGFAKSVTPANFTIPRFVKTLVASSFPEFNSPETTA